MRRIRISSILILLIAAGIIALLKNVLLLVFMAVVAAVALSFPVRLISRVLPRGAAVIIVVLALIGLGSGIASLASGTIADQWSQFESQLPAAKNRLQSWFRRGGPVGGALGPNVTGGIQKGVESQTLQVIRGALAKTGSLALGLTEGASAVIFVVVMAAFLVHEPESYKKLLRVLVPRGRERDFDELWDRVGQGLRRWVGGVLVAMALMGSFTAAGLALVGIHAWFLLGVFTFFGTFVPYVGAIASAIPGLIFALAQSNTSFLSALGVYLAVHILEGYLVEPLVMNRAVIIRPAALLFGQLALGTLAGVLGIIVATPLLACLEISVRYLYVEKTLHKENELAPSPFHRSA